MAVATPSPAASPRQAGALRWVIIGLIFFSIVLNQLDRQTLSVLATTVQRDLGMTDLDYARVVQLFLLAYTIGFLVTGRIADWLGTRVSFALFLGWWSVANMLSGFVRTPAELGGTRFLLALGEAGNYTVAPKAVAEWFPPKERALAAGIYTSGSMLGAVIAAPLIGWLALSYGWRMAFVVTGAAGIVWLVPWLLIYRPGRLTAQDPAEAGPRIGWGALLRRREVWALFAARLLTDPVWYFYLFWFPKYLQDERGLTLLQVAQTGWIVYLAADIGSLLGGLLSGRFVAGGMRPIDSRLRVFGLVAIIAPLGGLVAIRPNLWILFVLASIVAFVHLAWLTNLAASIVDLFPSRQVATVSGLIGAGSGLGGVLSTEAIGRLVSHASYDAVFVGLALLHPLGWLALRSLRATQEGGGR